MKDWLLTNVSAKLPQIWVSRRGGVPGISSLPFSVFLFTRRLDKKGGYTAYGQQAGYGFVEGVVIVYFASSTDPRYRDVVYVSYNPYKDVPERILRRGGSRGCT